jgi:hypothetical protein
MKSAAERLRAFAAQAHDARFGGGECLVIDARRPLSQQHARRHDGNIPLRLIEVVLLPVLLDARGAQAGEAVLVDRILPGEKFLDRQRVTAAGFFE